MQLCKTTLLVDDGFAALLCRVRAEYLEMPGLQLTAAQAARLWTVDVAVSNAVLATLVEARFLVRTRKEAFARRS